MFEKNVVEKVKNYIGNKSMKEKSTNAPLNK